VIFKHFIRLYSVVSRKIVLSIFESLYSSFHGAERERESARIIDTINATKSAVSNADGCQSNEYVDLFTPVCIIY
jgi:hypothetical protein